MRPAGPVPITSPTSTPVSFTIRRTAGERFMSAGSGFFCGAGFSAFSSVAEAAFFCGDGTAFSGSAARAFFRSVGSFSTSSSLAAFSVGAAAAVSMVPTTAPIETVSPSPTLIFNTPSASASTSRVTLSVSMTNSASPFWTWSPSFLNHCASTASATDSPTLGILISTNMASPKKGS